MNLRRRAVPVMGGTGKDVRCPADGQPVTGNGTMPVTSRARAGGPDGFSNSPRVSWRAQNPLQKSCVGWFVPLIRLPLARIASRWHEPSPCTRYRYSSGSHRNRDLPQFAWTRSKTLRGRHAGVVPALAPGRVLA